MDWNVNSLGSESKLVSPAMILSWHSTPDAWKSLNSVIALCINYDGWTHGRRVYVRQTARGRVYTHARVIVKCQVRSAGPASKARRETGNRLYCRPSGSSRRRICGPWISSGASIPGRRLRPPARPPAAAAADDAAAPSPPSRCFNIFVS